MQANGQTGPKFCFLGHSIAKNHQNHGMQTKHSDVLRATMDIVIKAIIEDKINNLVITISE